MKKNPIHFYWGRKNGLVVTREDAEGNHRVIIKFDGKLLPYAKKGQYPW